MPLVLGALDNMEATLTEMKRTLDTNRETIDARFAMLIVSTIVEMRKALRGFLPTHIGAGITIDVATVRGALDGLLTDVSDARRWVAGYDNDAQVTRLLALVQHMHTVVRSIQDRLVNNYLSAQPLPQYAENDRRHQLPADITRNVYARMLPDDAVDTAFPGSYEKIKAALENGNDIEEAYLHPFIAAHVDELNLAMANARLSKTIGALVGLQVLRIQGSVQELPAELGNLAALRELTILSSAIAALPVTLGQLTNLVTLGVRRNNLLFLPDTIGQLTNLRVLSLDGNKLVALPDTIGQLTSLERLSANENNITALPDTIGQLTKLDELTLHTNKLATLPDTVSRLASLRILNVRYNPGIVLPPALAELPRLGTVQLDPDNKGNDAVVKRMRQRDVFVF